MLEMICESGNPVHHNTLARLYPNAEGDMFERFTMHDYNPDTGETVSEALYLFY